MNKAHWDGISFLDILRPDLGWQVEIAILTSYSVDLVTLVAAMLALAGLDDDRGSGRKVDFANAYEQLRGRLCVLVQQGRIASPSKQTGLVGILDRFLIEINEDESRATWHPKIALVKYRFNHEPELPAEWRLWVGSRNLTSAMTWEAGLVLMGRENGGGQKLPGVDQLGVRLAEKAGFEAYPPDKIESELKTIRWVGPSGVRVEDLRLTFPGKIRQYPSPPSGIKKLIIVSPFLDGKTVRHLSKWGDKHTKRYLVSTIPDLTKLKAQSKKPLESFEDHLLIMDAPNTSTEFIVDSKGEEENNLEDHPEDEQIESRALHAKLIYASHTGGHSLWLGSANATQRGLLGPNAEVIAKLEVSERHADGLEAFIELAKTIQLADIPDNLEEEITRELLEKARIQIAAHWQVCQQRHPDGPILISPISPHPDHREIQMEVGLITGEFVIWTRGENQLQLPPVSKSKETELVKVKLSMDYCQSEWIQKAPLTPKPGEERDRHALAAHLDPSTFLQWIRSLLNAGELQDGGGEWHALPSLHKSGQVSGPMWCGPTLEEILTAWTHNPKNLEIADEKVGAYLKLIRSGEYAKQYTEEDLRTLDKFEQTWSVIRKVLITERR